MSERLSARHRHGADRFPRGRLSKREQAVLHYDLPLDLNHAAIDEEFSAVHIAGIF